MNQAEIQKKKCQDVLSDNILIGILIAVIILAIFTLLTGCSGGGGGGGSAPPPASSSSGSGSGGNPIPIPDPTADPTETTSSPTPTETTTTPTPTETTTSPSPTQTTITPTPAPTATINVVSTTGAQIWIDGNNTGLLSPNSYKMPVTIGQSIQLTLKKTGYMWYEETLIVSTVGSDYTFNINEPLVIHSDYVPHTVSATYTPPSLTWVEGGVCYDAITSRIYALISKWENSNMVYYVKVFDINLTPTPAGSPLEWQVGTSGTPWGITTDSSGNAYVSVGNVIKKFSSTGTLITGTIGQGIFSWVRGIKIKNDRLYCCDTDDKIKVFDLNGNFLYSFGYNGNSQTGEGALENPAWLEITDNGIFVIDESQYVRSFDLNGIHQYSKRINFQLAGICSQDANYLLYLDHQYIAKLYGQNGEGISYVDTGNNNQRDICADGSGNFYISDSTNNMLRKYY